jgi:hypothetical protein
MEGILGESGKADAVECIRLVTARGNVSCQWNSLQPTELFFWNLDDPINFCNIL